MGSIPVASPTPPRRLPLRRAPLIALAGLIAAVAVTIVILAFAWPENPAEPPHEWVSLARLEDLPVSEPVAFKDQRLYLVRLTSGEVLALSRRSTHLGCTVPWRADFEFQGKKGWFRDPCHGGTWARDGSLVFGPAPRDMDRYPVAVVDGEVIVDVLNRLCAPGALSATYSPCLPLEQYHGTPPRR